MRRKRGGSGAGGGVREKPNDILAWSETRPISQVRVCVHACALLGADHGAWVCQAYNSFTFSDDYG